MTRLGSLIAASRESGRLAAYMTHRNGHKPQNWSRASFIRCSFVTHDEASSDSEVTWWESRGIPQRLGYVSRSWYGIIDGCWCHGILAGNCLALVVESMALPSSLLDSHRAKDDTKDSGTRKNSRTHTISS